jgi:hypothetical protein
MAQGVFNPDTGDGHVYNNSSTWGGAHNATAGDGVDDTEVYTIAAAGYQPFINYFCYRAFFMFATGGIPDGATIDSATLAVRLSYYDGDGSTFRLVNTSQATADSLVVGDFDECGAVDDPTAGATDLSLSFADWLDWVTWTLNATGEGWINKTGWTKLGVREVDYDAEDDSPPYETTEAAYMNTADSSWPPVLTVNYTTTDDTEWQINIGDSWYFIKAAQINIGDAWKTVAGVQINIGDVWKTVF